jgi:hypothetical protein
MVEIRKQADEVKAARLAKQQEVASWVIAEPDDYVEKKSSAPKKRKKAKAGGDVGGSEGEAHSSGQEEEVERPKKKKAKPKKKYVDPDGDDGDTPMGSDGEEKAKPKPKKKVNPERSHCQIQLSLKPSLARSPGSPQEGDPRRGRRRGCREGAQAWRQEVVRSPPCPAPSLCSVHSRASLNSPKFSFLSVSKATISDSDEE